MGLNISCYFHTLTISTNYNNELEKIDLVIGEGGHKILGETRIF
jgi:hypothetical protein